MKKFKYDSVIEKANMKYFNLFAKKPEGDNNRVIEDDEHTITYFGKIMKLCNAKHPIILRRRLKEKYNTENKMYYSDEDLYDTLVTDDIARKFCEKQKLRNWQECINYKLMKETDVSTSESIRHANYNRSLKLKHAEDRYDNWEEEQL